MKHWELPSQIPFKKNKEISSYNQDILKERIRKAYKLSPITWGLVLLHLIFMS